MGFSLQCTVISTNIPSWPTLSPNPKKKASELLDYIARKKINTKQPESASLVYSTTMIFISSVLLSNSRRKPFSLSRSAKVSFKDLRPKILSTRNYILTTYPTVKKSTPADLSFDEFTNYEQPCQCTAVRLCYTVTMKNFLFKKNSSAKKNL